LSECSLCLPVESLSEIRHFIRLCYLAEIVKATIVFGRDCELPEILRNWKASKRVADIEGRIGYTEYQLDLLQRFAKVVGGSLGSPGELTTMSSFVLAVFRQLIAAYAAPFLRKTVILLHTRFGILFPPSDFAAAGEPEHTRLCNMLGLPNVDALLSAFLADDAEGHRQREIVSGWCKHLLRKHARPTISHPSIFELVGLPLHFDTLMEEAMRRGCPSTGDDITDPCVCLFCGEIFCGQALCCTKQFDSIETGPKKLGGCNRHVLKCGQNLGLFINIRKCALLYLHNYNGAWAEAPYMDAHGETDLGLRRSRQLFLNQRRYDALIRNVWLQHGIPSVISRRLEADLNTGGWDSL